MAGGAGTKVVLQAIGGNGFITIIKFIGFVLTNSPSMMAEAVHSLADTFNQILLLIGMKQAKSKASNIYSTGMGNASYIWNLVSAVGVFFIGFGVTFYHGMHSLIEGHFDVGEISWIAIGILTVSLIIEAWVLYGAVKEVNRQREGKPLLQFFKESDDPTIIAILLEDGVAVLGVSLALTGILLGQFLGSAIFDIIVSLIISFLLAFLAIGLGIINGKLLIGKRVTIHKESEMKEFIEGIDQVDRIVSLSTKIIGTSQVRLSVELILYGERVIDHLAIEKDVKKIEEGESTHKVLLKSSERAIRLAGKHVNEIEIKIQEQFPEVKIIDLEVE